MIPFLSNVKNHRFLRTPGTYKKELFVIFANLLGPVAQLAPILFTLKYITPEDLGTCESIFLVVAYFAFVPLGVFNGLSRNIAVLEGEGNLARAQKQVATSWAVAHGIAGIGLLVGLGFVIYYWRREPNGFALLCAFALVINLCLSSYDTLIQVFYAGSRSYVKLGSTKMLSNSSAILTSWLPYLIGAPALLVRKLSVAAAPVLVKIFTEKDKYTSRPSFSFPEYRDLVMTGFPIMLSGYLGRILLVADQSIIALHLGKEKLGYYALSIFLIMALMQVPRSFSLIFYPKAAYAYGKTKNPKTLRKYIMLSLFANLCALVPVCLLSYFLLDYVVQYFPKYQNGLTSAKIACFTGMFMSYGGASIAFMVLKRNLIYQIILGSGIGIMWLVGSLLIRYGYGIEAIAFTRLGVTFAVGLLVIGLAFWLTRSPGTAHEKSKSYVLHKMQKPMVEEVF